MIKQAVEDLLKVHKVLGVTPKPVSTSISCEQYPEDTCRVNKNLLDVVIKSDDEYNIIILSNETATELAVALLQGVLSDQFK